MDLNTETRILNDYEVFLLFRLQSICTPLSQSVFNQSWQFPKDILHSRPCTLNWTELNCTALHSDLLNRQLNCAPLLPFRFQLLRSVRVRVTLRLTVSQYRAPSGAHDQILIMSWKLQSCQLGAPSLTRGRESRYIAAARTTPKT
jgi:hypothetical protein